MAEREDRLEPDQLAAYFTLIEVGNLLEHAVAEQLRADGDLSPVQFQILANLMGAPDGLRMTDVADRLVVSRSGLSYQVDQLAGRGLVVRSPAPDDDRSTIVRTTDDGRELIESVMAGHVALVRRLVFADMPDADVGALNRALGPVRQRLRAAPPRSARARRAAR